MCVYIYIYTCLYAYRYIHISQPLAYWRGIVVPGRAAVRAASRSAVTAEATARWANFSQALLWKGYRGGGRGAETAGRTVRGGGGSGRHGEGGQGP